MDYLRATELSVSAGQRFIFPLFFMLGLLEENIVLVVISGALFIASGSELKLVKLKRAFLGLAVGDVARKPVPKVAGSVIVRDFIAGVVDGSTTHYLVHGEDGRVLGVLDLRELGGVSRRDLLKPVGEYAQKEYATVDAGRRASEAMKEFLSNEFLLAVSDKKVVGYITPHHVVEEYNVMSLKRALR
jgi:signal-transduction protein with cAMP-binding, CBS, and nucleotidyltransferase domain